MSSSRFSLRAPLRIDVAGGGPVGLAFALAVRACGVHAAIRIFEPRWQRVQGRMAWRGLAQGNRRRQQIVTIQSNVWQALPPALQQALFGPQDYSEVWPGSSDSPVHHGPPRNLPLRDIEDRLLELVQEEPEIELHADRYDPSAIRSPSLLAICDGAHSPTREHFIPQFGRPHADLYQVNGRALDETILGMQVRCDIPPGEAVLLTAMQNRYLLNTHRGTGFLNLRLTRAEAEELRGLGRAADESVPIEAVRDSSLWPAIRAGLQLFAIAESDLVCVRAFRCALVHRPRFVAQLAHDTWGCLLGDAANALHFWPGRGLNTGLKSALSLARCLARQRGERLRAADFVEHEGVMHMLQAREVGNRAWQTMLMCDEDGTPRPIEERIRCGLEGACDRPALTGELMTRVRATRARLASRVGALPDDCTLSARLDRLDARTLKVLVETGAWISAEVAGPEVDVATLLPLPTPRPRSPSAAVVPLRRAA
jgi:2-polyprenyl-6-methoxyphenol hydroxylase-like FAD-dependent oxidoreductase